MGKLIDTVLSSGKSTTSEKAEIIHISLKGKRARFKLFCWNVIKAGCRKRTGEFGRSQCYTWLPY